MKTIKSKQGISRYVKGPSFDIWTSEIRVSEHSKLSALLMVFETKSNLDVFVSRINGCKTGSFCRGVCVPLYTERFSITKDGAEKNHRRIVDPRFFCVIGLIKKHISIEVVIHESVHAGFAYAERVGKKKQWPGSDENSDESVCYPSGTIATQALNALREGGFFE